MPKKARDEQRRHWVLSEKMRAWFIQNQWNTNNQFLVDKMMCMDDFLTRHPLPNWILNELEQPAQRTMDNNPKETP